MYKFYYATVKSFFQSKSEWFQRYLICAKTPTLRFMLLPHLGLCDKKNKYMRNKFHKFGRMKIYANTCSMLMTKVHCEKHEIYV